MIFLQTVITLYNIGLCSHCEQQQKVRPERIKRHDRPNTVQDANIQKRLEVTIICTCISSFVANSVLDLRKSKQDREFQEK